MRRAALSSLRIGLELVADDAAMLRRTKGAAQSSVPSRLATRNMPTAPTITAPRAIAASPPGELVQLPRR
jgi:hypothetical protein